MPKKKPDQEPLTRDQLRMVSEFRKYRDIYQAAEKAKIPKNQAVKIFNLVAFQEELDRQDEAVRTERAKLEVKAESLTRGFLDGELTKLIQKDHSLEALRLGYVVVGAVQDKNLRSSAAPSGDDPPPTNGPTFIYRAMVEGTMSPVAEPILPDAPPPPPPIGAPAASQPAASPSRTGPLKIG